MTEETNISDNNGSNSEVLGPVAGRRPGRPKGSARTPGSGRAKGTPNHATRDVRQAAQRYTLPAIKTLAALLDHPDAKTRAIAARELLDRGHGKPVSPTEISGPDGQPLRAQVLTAGEGSTIDLARWMVNRMTDAAVAKLPAGTPVPSTYDGLQRVISDQSWSPDEPAEVEARARMFRSPIPGNSVPEPTPEARPEPQHATIDHTDAQALQRAERDAARGEGRLERPMPAWTPDKPRAGEDYDAPATRRHQRRT